MGVSFMVIHHSLQKLYNPRGFADNVIVKYFGFLPFPMLWTYMAAVMEFVGPIMLALGIFARAAAFGLMFTMFVAVAFHFQNTGVEGFSLGVPKTGAYAFEPAMLCGVIFLHVLLNGPGRFAVCPTIEEDTYTKLIDKAE